MTHAGDPAPADWQARIKKFNLSQFNGVQTEYVTADQAEDMLGIAAKDFELLAKTAFLTTDWYHYWEDLSKRGLYHLTFIYYAFVCGKNYKLELALMREKHAEQTGKPRMSRRQARRNERILFLRSPLSFDRYPYDDYLGDDGVNSEM